MKKLIIILITFISLFANSCKNKLFSLSTNGENSIVLQNLITDIADTCRLNVIIKDNLAKEKLRENIKYLKLKNKTLKELLEAVLSRSGFFYKLDKNNLEISYIKTKYFKLDYLKTEDTDTMWNEYKDNITSILNSLDSAYKNPIPIIDKMSGLITVTGTKKQLQKVQEYITNLNNRLHKEVLIDVKIYSVRLSKSHSTGINWSNLNISAGAAATMSGNIGQTIFDSTKFNVSGVLNFLSTYGQVNSISNPKITTLNNQPAVIDVGQNIYYSYKVVTTDANGNAVQSDKIDQQFVGITLNITPEISDNDIILMTINPVISSISQINPNLPPNTLSKKLNTMVRIKDGYTIILGGLITDDKTFTRNGVPVLKEIPVLKYLFSAKEEISNREELVFIVTPHIIDLNKNMKIDKNFTKLPKLEDF